MHLLAQLPVRDLLRMVAAKVLKGLLGDPAGNTDEVSSRPPSADLAHGHLKVAGETLRYGAAQKFLGPPQLAELAADELAVSVQAKHLHRPSWK